MLVAETKKSAITKGTDEETIDIVLLAVRTTHIAAVFKPMAM
jgi:hypothetical protein